MNFREPRPETESGEQKGVSQSKWKGKEKRLKTLNYTNINYWETSLWQIKHLDIWKRRMQLQMIDFLSHNIKRTMLLTKIALFSAGLCKHWSKLCAERSRVKIPEDKNYGSCPVLISRLKRWYWTTSWKSQFGLLRDP